MAKYSFDSNGSLVAQNASGLKLSSIAVGDKISGGVWKLNENFKSDKLTFQNELIEQTNSNHSICFDKYLEIDPSVLAKYFDSTLSDVDCLEKFGSTKIHLWYNSQFPLIGVTRYEDNTIESTDDNVSAIWAISKLAYPVLAFATTDETVEDLDQDGLNETSQLKVIDLGLEDAEFNLTWKNDLYKEVTLQDWLKDVETWITIHNSCVFSEEYKSSDAYIMNSSSTSVHTKKRSILHTLTQNRIENLASLFFTVG